MAENEGADGEIGILNIGAGDTKISFNPSIPAEVERAKRIVTDMLRRGYAILIEVEKDGVKTMKRVKKFDAKRCEYIVEGEPREEISKTPAPGATTAATEAKAQRGRPRGTTRIAARSTRGVAVSPIAGG